MTEFFIGRTKVGRNSDKNFSSEYSDQVRRNELPLAKILMLPINHKTQISSNTITIYVVLSSETEIGRVNTYRSTGVIGFNYFDKLAKAISSIEFKVHCKKLNCFKGIGRGGGLSLRMQKRMNGSRDALRLPTMRFRLRLRLPTMLGQKRSPAKTQAPFKARSKWNSGKHFPKEIQITLQRISCIHYSSKYKPDIMTTVTMVNMKSD